REQFLSRTDATQRITSNGNKPASVMSDVRECGGHEHRLFHRTAHSRNAANFVHSRPDHGEIEPFRASDVAIKDLPDMKAKVHFCNGKPTRRTALVQLEDASPCRYRRSQGRIAGTFPIFSGENSEGSVSHYIQTAASLSGTRRDNDIGIVVQQGNYMLRLSIGDSREAAQIAKPKHGIDAIGHAAHDSTAQYSAAGIASEVSLHQ